MENENNIQLRSEEVQEILGHIPSRIIRYGIAVVLAVVVLLFAGSFFFKYPDILSAPVEVVTQNPPAAIVAKVSGNLTHIFVRDSQQVELGQLLAVIKNPAQTTHVQWVKTALLPVAHSSSFTNDWLMQWPDTLVLGEMQPVYASFLKTCSDFRQFRQLNYHPQKIVALKDKNSELERYAQIMERQSALKQQDYELAQNQFRRDSGLYAKQVISLSDYERGRQSLLQNRMAVETSKSAVVNTKIQLHELQQQITDLQADEIRQKQAFENTMAEQLQNLENQIKGWFDTWVLTSPIDGVVAFNKIWSSNQFVQSGEEVFVVVPRQQSAIIGRITLAAQGAGKVRLGQLVNLKFQNFPYQEFGMITAQVSAISLVPANQNYTIEVNLPDTLITNYGYQLPFTQKMLGTAEIITEDLPLMVRLFNPLKAILKKHWGGSPLPKAAHDNREIKAINPTAPTPIAADSAVPVQNLAAIPTDTKPPTAPAIAPEYYIIAASFSDAAKAQQAMLYYQSKNFNCNLLHSGDRFRIAIFNTGNKEGALQQLNRLRTQLCDDKLWLYTPPVKN